MQTKQVKDVEERKQVDNQFENKSFLDDLSPVVDENL